MLRLGTFVRRSARHATAAALVPSSIVLASVSSCAPTAPSQEGPEFVAYESDFEGYRRWTHYTTEGSVVDNVHVAGPRTEYINHLPPHGSKTFPVGTIVVKEPADLSAPGAHIFAMVKEGGNVNADGATGWLFFEIVNYADESVDVLWSGAEPPANEHYAGVTNADCNGCHARATRNDSVVSTKIVLSGD